MTIWYKNSFRRISRAALLLVFVAGAAVFVCPQDDLETRYQKAIQFFNAPKMEDACDLFQQIEKEHPNYKNTHTYLNPACVSAKSAYSLEEKLYNQGTELMKGNHFDDAKAKFAQAQALTLNHPKYRTQIEASLKQIAQMEAGASADSQFNEAVQAFNAGKLDEASRLFTKIEQAKGPRADEARTYLRKISEQGDDATWARAVDAFNKGDLANARTQFTEISRGGGKHAGEAQNYLAKLKAVEGDDKTFQAAMGEFNAHRYSEAQSKFEELVKKGSPRAKEAQGYLQRINAAQSEESKVQEQAKKRVADSGQNPQQVAQQFMTEARTSFASGQFAQAADKLRAAQVLDPANHEIENLLAQAQQKAGEQPLRDGLKAYFEGRYDQAEQQFSAYVNGGGPKVQLAYFFRGASYASQYFLSESTNRNQRDLAVADFRALQKGSAGFKPPGNYVSPKIFALYTQALSANR